MISVSFPAVFLVMLFGFCLLTGLTLFMYGAKWHDALFAIQTKQEPWLGCCERSIIRAHGNSQAGQAPTGQF